MYKYLIGALGAGVLVALLYNWGYSSGVASMKTKNLTTTVVQTGEARKIEQGIVAKQSDLDLNYQKGAIDASKTTQVLVDSLLNGSVRMSVPGPAAPAVPGDTAATRKRHDQTSCELPGKTAADLARLAADADANTRQLGLCQDVIDAYQALMPKWAAPQTTHLAP